MATTAVTIVPETPAGESEESEASWESVLSEVRTELQSGFGRLETTLREAMENPRLVETLTAANTALTSQITEMNQSLVSRLDSLTQQPSVPIVVAVETPLSVTPSLDEGAIVLPVEAEDQTEVPEARRKRRTI